MLGILSTSEVLSMKVNNSQSRFLEIELVQYIFTL